MKNKLLRIISTLLVSVMLIMSMTSCGIIFDDGEFVLVENIISFFESPAGFIGRTRTIINTENYSVNANMMSYFVNVEYQKFMESYEPYLSSNEKDGMLSYNPDIPMNEQNFGGEGGKNFYDEELLGEFEGTWREYFIHSTETHVLKLLEYCEYANANGICLDENDYAEIDSNIEVYEAYAGAMGFDRLNQLLGKAFGEGVSEKDVRDCMELSVLANKAMEHIEKTIRDSVTEIEIDARYNGHILEYSKVDYTVCRFRIEYGDYYSSAVYAEKITEIKDAVNALQKCESYDAFKAKANSIYQQIFEKAPETDFMEECSIFYSPENKMIDWLFDSARRENDTRIEYIGDASENPDTVNNGEAEVNVYFIRVPKHKDNSRTKNFCYALFTDYQKAQGLVSKLQGREDLSRSEFKNIAEYLGADVFYSENYVKGTFSEYTVGVPGDEYGNLIVFQDKPIIAPDTTMKLPIFHKSAGDTEVSSAIVNDGGYTFNEDFTINKDYTADKGVSFKDEISIKDYLELNKTPFNDWLFDENTQTGVVCPEPYTITVGGVPTYIVAVLEGDGDEVWRINIKNDIVAEKMSMFSVTPDGYWSAINNNYDMVRFAEEDFNFFDAIWALLDNYWPFSLI